MHEANGKGGRRNGTPWGGVNVDAPARPLGASPAAARWFQPRPTSAVVRGAMLGSGRHAHAVPGVAAASPGAAPGPDGGLIGVCRPPCGAASLPTVGSFLCCWRLLISVLFRPFFPRTDPGVLHRRLDPGRASGVIPALSVGRARLQTHGHVTPTQRGFLVPSQ